MDETSAASAGVTTLMDVHAALRVAPGNLFVDGVWRDGDGPRFEQRHPAASRSSPRAARP